MLTMHLSVAVLALSTLACGAASGGAGPAPRTATPPVVSPSPSPSIPMDAKVVQGAFAHLNYNTAAKGFLWIDVQSTRAPGGRVTTTVKYERNVKCHRDPVTKKVDLFACTLAWTKKVTVPADAFTLDPLLGSASLKHTLQNKPVTITWTGVGDVRRQHNEGGNLLYELRDALGDVRWGKDRFVDKPGTQDPAALFRRIPDPTAP